MSADIASELVVEVAQRARVDASTVNVDAHLMMELGMSSLDVLAVLAFTEERYGVLFPDDELLTLSTIRKIESAVLSHQKVAS